MNYNVNCCPVSCVDETLDLFLGKKPNKMGSDIEIQ